MDEELDFKPVIKCYVNDEVAFFMGELKEGSNVTIFRPDINAKIIIKYMSDEEWDDIQMENEEGVKN